MYECGIYMISSNGYLITFGAKLQALTLHLHQIAGLAGCILTTSDFREPAVYLVTSIRGTPVSCLLVIRY